MKKSEIEKNVLMTLREVTPDADLRHLERSRNFRDQIEMDSLDFLNFALLLERRFRCRVPESDYPKLSNLTGCIAYFASRSPTPRK